MSEIKLHTPLDDEKIKSLKAGDIVKISGYIFTARDAAHKRFAELLKAGSKLPIDLEGQIIYYVGPSPAPPGRPVGSAGPTSSYRMDVFTPQLLHETGLRGMIGKGNRSKEVVTAIKATRSVYFVATGGAAALLSGCIMAVDPVCYEDLGAEAVTRFTVKNFPVIVAIDSQGNNVYERIKPRVNNSDF